MVIEGLTEHERSLLLNALRMAIRQCRELETDIRKRHAFEKVYGTPIRAEGELETLAVASETTAKYVRLLTRLNGSGS